MADVAKTHQERLKDLKKNVEQAQTYFDANVRRFHEYTKFVFKSSLTEDQIGILQEVGKPTLEFNILEAYVSTLRGEFAEQQPSLKVRAADGLPASMVTPQFVQTIDIVEAHLRSIFCDATNDDLAYNLFTDLLAGGFSVARVFTDYVNEMSLEQNIYVKRTFDPTLCGFDPLARESHKGDGKFCFELFPMTRDDFDRDNGSDLSSTMSFSKNLSGFSWSYRNEKEDIVLVCDYYEKKLTKERVIKLSNGHHVLKREYDKFLKKVDEDWESYGIEKPPIEIESRLTYIETIDRYRFCEQRVLSHETTDFKHLPLVFFDGNSVNITQGNISEQMTRPYVYHAKGIQRLKNFAGQSLANELENLMQSQWIAPVEAIPTDYTEAYTNPQKADIVLYNHFLDSNSPEITIPPPREVARIPIPPQISETFRMSDEMTQTVLGTYDRAMGMKSAPVSGRAIERGTMQGNMASIPYNVGYTKGLNRVAQIIIDLIPKYYRTPKSLPVLGKDGKRSFVEVNPTGPKQPGSQQTGSIYMNYDPNSLQVNVSTGVNFAMQKELALQTIVHLMQASPLFAKFMNSEGLPILLDNIDIRGIEGLKEKADEFMKKEQQLQQLQSKSQMQDHQAKEVMMQLQVAEAQKRVESPSPEQVELAKLAEKSKFDSAELELKERDAETKYLELMSKIRNDRVDAELKEAQLDAENTRSAVEAAVNLSKHIHEE